MTLARSGLRRFGYGATVSFGGVAPIMRAMRLSFGRSLSPWIRAPRLRWSSRSGIAAMRAQVPGQGLIPGAEAAFRGHHGRAFLAAGGDYPEARVSLFAPKRQVADPVDDRQAAAGQGRSRPHRRAGAAPSSWHSSRRRGGRRGVPSPRHGGAGWPGSRGGRRPAHGPAPRRGSAPGPSACAPAAGQGSPRQSGRTARPCPSSAPDKGARRSAGRSRGPGDVPEPVVEPVPAGAMGVAVDRGRPHASQRILCGTPPGASKTRSCAAIRVSTLSVSAKRTNDSRPKPGVPPTTDNLFRPRRIAVRSACAGRPGGVSNRRIGGAGRAGCCSASPSGSGSRPHRRLRDARADALSQVTAAGPPSAIRIFRQGSNGSGFDGRGAGGPRAGFRSGARRDFRAVSRPTCRCRAIARRLSPCRCRIPISKVVAPVSLHPPDRPEGQGNSWASLQPANRVSFASALTPPGRAVPRRADRRGPRRSGAV